jgi:hypothetical protein
MKTSEDVVVEEIEGASETEVVAESDEEQAAEEASTDTAEEHPEAEGAAEDEAEAEAEVAAEAEAEAGAVTEESAEPSPPEQQPEPFSFKVDGRRVEVEGAYLIKHADPGGNPTESVVMPREVFARRVQPYLADRGAWASKEREFQRQLADRDPERNETVVRAGALVDEFDKLLKSEDALTAFLADFDRNAEALKLRAENRVLSAGLKTRDERDHSADEERRGEELVSTVQQDLPVVLRGAATHVRDALKFDVPENVLQTAYEEIADNYGLYYFRADERIAKEYGVEVGELVRDDDRLVRTVERFARLAASGSKQAEGLKAVEAKNAEALKAPKKKPPTVPAKGSPGSPEKHEPFKSREDFDAWAGLNH